MRSRSNYPRLCFLGLALFSLAVPAMAAEAADRRTEKERIRQCGIDLCQLIAHPEEQGAPIQCDLAQTWHKEGIKKAVKVGRLSWPFGDARCSIELDVDRDILGKALTEASYTMKIPPQPAKCEVENEGERHTLSLTLAPEVEFEDGKATEVSINLDEFKGNAVIRNAVWASWKMVNTFGLFQDEFVKGVNDYITKQCPKIMKNAASN